MRVFYGAFLALTLAAPMVAQERPLDPDALAEGFTRERPVPAEIKAAVKSWIEPAEPVRIVGPIYFVGTKGLGAYLLTTPKGHILLDGALPGSAKDVEASIRKLGFKPEDIRLLLITHAHCDHAGTTAYFKKLSKGKAKAVVMDRDSIALASGGRTDFQYGARPALYFPPVKPDRELADGETVKLGNVAMTARLGAGHTRGATTWTTTVEDGGRKYDVVFPCCTSVNPGYRLTVDPSYAGIADDYRRTFAMLESLHPDIWLAAHTEAFDFEGKRARAAAEGAAAWVDPDGYRRWVARGKEGFEAAVAAEQKTAPPEPTPARSASGAR
jgi:metallo-beta-lactamase class B